MPCTLCQAFVASSFSSHIFLVVFVHENVSVFVVVVVVVGIVINVNLFSSNLTCIFFLIDEKPPTCIHVSCQNSEGIKGCCKYRFYSCAHTIWLRSIIWNGNKSRRRNGSGSQPHPAAPGLGSVAPFFSFLTPLMRDRTAWHRATELTLTALLYKTTSVFIYWMLPMFSVFVAFTIQPFYKVDNIFIFIHQWMVERMQSNIQSDAITLTTNDWQR